MLFGFPLGERVQHEFVRIEKIHIGETSYELMDNRKAIPRAYLVL